MEFTKKNERQIFIIMILLFSPLHLSQIAEILQIPEQPTQYNNTIPRPIAAEMLNIALTLIAAIATSRITYLFYNRVLPTIYRHDTEVQHNEQTKKNAQHSDIT